MNIKTGELRELAPDEPLRHDEVEVKGCCGTHAEMALWGSNRAQRRKFGTRCSWYDGPMPERIKEDA